ncbi:hypothetical protein Aph01nite_22920 [Acrocarpospora phusangensis]|uniref:Hydrolase n=1 Tax=Acrocarpospora phusangensis TaxID=1070424 RepID=A0A919QCX4_9ACTN|nr:GH25 family lysozyme [Acrocarpospora phusangensis]GIH23982.1 hypothetical protein Aph01nite_22920 [Acrocarpospora phusangensis]
MPTHRRSWSAPTRTRLRYALAGLCAAMSVATAVSPASTAHAAPMRAAEPEFTYGQDISAYQASYDWHSSPAQFGLVKATEGLTFRDSSFARQWHELAKKGIVRGAYHYGHPDDDPIAEANHFLSVVNSQPAKRGDLLALDLETAAGQSVAHVNAWAKTWLAHVKAKTGITPLFYSSWSFADTYGHGLSAYPLWVADYGKTRGQVTPPADWKTWTIHQYSDTPVDQNVSSLTTQQLRVLGRR